MKGSLTVANLMTSGSLAAGFLALILAEQGEYSWAAGCVGVAAVLDSVDGLVARRMRTECERQAARRAPDRQGDRDDPGGRDRQPHEVASRLLCRLEAGKAPRPAHHKGQARADSGDRD